MQIVGMGQKVDWKMFLVQELCDASLADVLEVSILHDKHTKQPHMVIDYSNLRPAGQGQIELFTTRNCHFFLQFQNSVMFILLGVARGLRHIHEKNIIHGDLK